MSQNQENLQNVIEDLKNRIDRAIQLVAYNRAYVFVLRGPHNSRKSYILNDLKLFYKEKMVILNYNIMFSQYSMEKKKREEILNHPLKFLRETIDNYGETYDIIAIDHMEWYYDGLTSIEPLITTLIHKSREKYINKHHIVLIITIPTSKSLKRLNESFSNLGNQLNSITIFSTL